MKNKFKKTLNYKFLLFLGLITLASGCESFIETDPPSNRLNGLNVFKRNETAIAAVTELYGKLVSGATGNIVNNVSLQAGLSADELTLFNSVNDLTHLSAYKNNFRASQAGTYGGAIWTTLYQYILSANSSIEGLESSDSLYPIVKNQLLGECYFVRSFCFFYLTTLYGDVPLALTSDPNINNNLKRSSKDDVYSQMISDLKLAKQLLSSSYVNRDMLPYSSNAERIRPNRGAANALLARVYLFWGGHDIEAEAAATEVINQTELYELQPLNNVFLKNSKEAIWQLQPIRTGRNTDNGFMFILPSTGPNATAGINGNPVYLSNSLLNSFEPGDARSSIGMWVNRTILPNGTVYNYPYKYKVKAVSAVTEYEMVLRLGEQYLIRAEARAKQGNLTGANSAASDLNIIRARAGLPATTATSQLSLYEAILNERRTELFAEWGHRWLDIKRSGKIDQIMNIATTEKLSTWRNFQKYYPIPFADIQYSRALVQNEGY